MKKTPQDQDYAQWLDISFFRKHLTSNLSFIISESKLSTLANVCAITHAMKIRDFNAGLIAKPEPKEVVVDFCVNNISKYLYDNDSSEIDWLELFVAGHDTGKDKNIDKGKNQQQMPEYNDDHFNDDEYVRMAALSYMKATSNDLTTQQQMVEQILKAQQHMLQSNKYIQKRVFQKSWLGKISDYFTRVIDFSNGRIFLLGLQNKKKKYFITIPSIISGTTTGAAIIIGMQLFPAYGFFTFLTSAVVGYFSGLGLYKSVRDIFVGVMGSSEASHLREKDQVHKLDNYLKKEKESTVHRRNKKQVSTDGLPLDSALVESINSSIKAAAAASVSAGQLMTPEKTPQVNRVAANSHVERVLLNANSDGGSGRGV